MIWIGFDTPVDDDDNADGAWVIEQTVNLLMDAPRRARS